ncbi:MAG: ABC transporter permease [Gimesia sp.]|nr:ABC transporter permease [Gimesia sp.]
MKLIAYILKSLWGHRARTMLTVAGSAVALFVFCFIQSIQEGMNDLKQRQEARGSLIVFQANKFCPATSHLPQDYDQQISKFAGVKDVVPIQVFTNNCRASLDVVVFYGVPPQKLRTARDFEFLSGNWTDFETHQDAAIIGRAVAARRGIKVGDKFSIGDLSVNVAGIYQSDNPAEENYIYSHLDFLQRRQGTNLVGTVTQLEVILKPGTDPLVTSTAIDEKFRGGPVETNTHAKGVFQAKSLGDLSQLIEMSYFLGLACVGLVLALVATTTLMSVEDRIQEHAVLRTLGFSGFKVFGLVLAESTLLSIAGGLLGVGTALITLKISSLSVGAEAVTVAFIPSLHLAWVGMLLAMLTGICAGIVPACYASRTEIVPALRHV